MIHMLWDELPTELRRDLISVNVGKNIKNLEKRLHDRRRANVLSYLHLCSLRLSSENTLKSRFYSNIDNLHEMRTYLDLVTHATKIHDA